MRCSCEERAEGFQPVPVRLPFIPPCGFAQRLRCEGEPFPCEQRLQPAEVLDEQRDVLRLLRPVGALEVKEDGFVSFCYEDMLCRVVHLLLADVEPVKNEALPKKRAQPPPDCVFPAAPDPRQQESSIHEPVRHEAAAGEEKPRADSVRVEPLQPPRLVRDPFFFSAFLPLDLYYDALSAVHSGENQASLAAGEVCHVAHAALHRLPESAIPPYLIAVKPLEEERLLLKLFEGEAVLPDELLHLLPTRQR